MRAQLLIFEIPNRALTPCLLPSLPKKYDFALTTSAKQLLTIQANAVQALTQRPTDDELLELYGLYKQATTGDNTTTRPGAFDFKGKYKWDAWKKLEGTSESDAESQYIEMANSMLEKYQ